jgi:hypothetical protein
MLAALSRSVGFEKTHLWRSQNSHCLNFTLAYTGSPLQTGSLRTLLAVQLLFMELSLYISKFELGEFGMFCQVVLVRTKSNAQKKWFPYSCALTIWLCVFVAMAVSSLWAQTATIGDLAGVATDQTGAVSFGVSNPNPAEPEPKTGSWTFSLGVDRSSTLSGNA